MELKQKDGRHGTHFTDLPIEDQKLLQDIFNGKSLPPLYSDIIAKKIFHADVHPDRLNFLLRSVAKDDTIDVNKSASNESLHQSIHAKGMVSDMPSWLKDRRKANVEIQRFAQDFIFTRIDLYGADMLLLQYTVEEGQSKSELDYTNVSEVVLVVLMVESPKPFKKFDSDKYIHRFTKMTADTGLTYDRKVKVMYVQLDKCLK